MDGTTVRRCLTTRWYEYRVFSRRLCTYFSFTTSLLQLELRVNTS